MHFLMLLRPGRWAASLRGCYADGAGAAITGPVF